MALERLILWKPLQKATIVMYALVFLLALPYPKLATLLLFGIVALWSRIPAMMTMFTKDVEVVDFFTMNIAINLGPLTGGIFGWFIILFSRIFGPTEDLDYTLKESVCFFVSAHTSYFIYAYLGANIMVTMFAFTFVRYVFYIFLDLITTPGKLPYTLTLMSMGIPVAIISNLLLVNMFGPALDRIFAKGAVLSWELLLFVTAVIGIFYFVSRFMFREEQKRVELHGEKGRGMEFGGEGTIAEGMLAVPEPHEALFSMFTLPDFGAFFYTTPKFFKGFISFVMFFLVLVGASQSGTEIGYLNMIIIFIGIYFIIEIMHWALNKWLVKNPIY